MTRLTIGLSALTLAVGCAGSSEDTGADAILDPSGGLACEDGICVLSGTITEDTTLTADTTWLLRGGVFIGDDINPTVLTIEAGTTIYGETSTDGMLVIRRNSQIMAEGTAEAPIVMTSSKAAGTRARGDWGGLIINGNAPINACADAEAGACEAYGEGGTGWYGGNDAADNSGSLKYVRVEFAGTLISPDNELNGIAFQGVGNGTEVDYIQVHMNADDGVEFYGGTVNAKHVVVSAVGDDSMDWTDGWQGNAQFVVLHQHDDNGDNGIEADNNGDSNEATPRSMPHLSNLTIIGSPESESSDIGILLREGTAAVITDVLVKGFNAACLDIDDAATWGQVSEGNLTINGAILDCVDSFDEDDLEDAEEAGESVEGISVSEWFAAWEGNTEGDVPLADPYNLTAPDFTHSAGVTPYGPASTDSFFETVDFVGGVGSDDWTAGWTNYELN